MLPTYIILPRFLPGGMPIELHRWAYPAFEYLYDGLRTELRIFNQHRSKESVPAMRFLRADNPDSLRGYLRKRSKTAHILETIVILPTLGDQESAQRTMVPFVGQVRPPWELPVPQVCVSYQLVPPKGYWSPEQVREQFCRAIAAWAAYQMCLSRIDPRMEPDCMHSANSSLREYYNCPWMREEPLVMPVGWQNRIRPSK